MRTLHPTRVDRRKVRLDYLGHTMDEAELARLLGTTEYGTTRSGEEMP